jgi:lysophospholipase L1-like esterase
MSSNTVAQFVLSIAALLALAAPGLSDVPPTVEGETRWYDCRHVGLEGKGWTDTPTLYHRLPAKAEGKAPAKDWALSHMTAGLCVRFSTDAPSLQVRWTLTSPDLAMQHMPATGVSGVDVYARDESGQWRFVHNGRPSAISNMAAGALPPAAEYLVYLPLYNGVKSIELGVPRGHAVSKPDAGAAARRKSVVFYGGSITQGGCASRPGMAYTAVVGRRLDATVVNLGFSGSGVMEPAMADLLAELDPSAYVLDTLGNMSVEQVSERVEPFVRKLRAAHPSTPILLVEDASSKGVSPTERGRALQAICDGLTSQGVKDLHFLPNRGMLGDDGEGTVDGVHPSDLGMMRHADVFTEVLRPLLRESE